MCLKGYRGFESLALRHRVLKISNLPPSIQICSHFRPKFSILACKRGRREISPGYTFLRFPAYLWSQIRRILSGRNGASSWPSDSCGILHAIRYHKLCVHWRHQLPDRYFGTRHMGHRYGGFDCKWRYNFDSELRPGVDAQFCGSVARERVVNITRQGNGHRRRSLRRGFAICGFTVWRIGHQLPLLIIGYQQ